MKKSLFLFLLLAGATAQAQSITTGYPSNQVITIPTPAYDIRFSVAWFADDYPQNSAPGRIELVRDGVVTGRVTASHYRDSGPSISVMSGTVDNVSSSVDIFTPGGAPADGFLYGTWHLTGLTPGTYTVRAWTYRTDEKGYYATTVWTDTSFDDGYSPLPANRAPTIAWVSAPASVGSGQDYTITARGHDDDGNLTQVNVWKNGQPFAFAGGGNGTDGDSGNSTSDAGPQTVTFTAQAVDVTGATSPVITHVVTINAPVNNPPTVTLLSPAGQTVTAGTTLTLSARATDPDGNLSGHNLDIQRPAGDWNFQGGFATGEPYQGGPVGSGGDSTRTASFTFIDVGTYYVRSGAYDGSGWYHSATVAITVVPANRAPTIAWTSTPGTVASGQGYTIAAHGHDDDGNLSEVRIWKNGSTVANVAAGGTDVDASNSDTDAGPQTITYTAQAFDVAGAASATIAQTVTVTAPPPAQYTLMTSAGVGGSVSASGTFVAGSTAYVTATPDATHDFAGWSGDAAGSPNPLGIVMDRNKAVQANFSLKAFALTTSATAGGSVTPGGTYPYGTLLTLSGTPDGTHRFLGWSGDASGTAPAITVLVNRALWVQAVFTDKTAQTISFAPLANQPVGGGPITLAATATSGLPVSYAVVSGPASLAGNQLTVTGPGAITVQASQPGDSEFLAAPSVARTFNAVAAAVLKYRPTGRTLLQGHTTGGTTPFVLERP